MTVRWTVIPSNGLATDGEPRAFERSRKAGAKKGPFSDPLRQASSEGTPHGQYPYGAQSPGERFFGYFLVATRKYLAFGCENPIKTIAD